MQDKHQLIRVSCLAFFSPMGIARVECDGKRNSSDIYIFDYEGPGHFGDSTLLESRVSSIAAGMPGKAISRSLAVPVEVGRTKSVSHAI